MNNLIHLPTWLNKVEQWMQTSENNANKLTVLFLEAHSLPELLYNIFLIALVPSVGEELLFRGVFQRIFTEWFKNYHLGIWISAILFSLIHFQFYGFLSRLFLGASFGYLLEITKNMWLPILTHFVNNLVGVLIAYFISPEKMINTNFYNFSFIEFIYAILGLLVGIACFWLIAKKAKRIL
jgi:membrane protease YdiL (CAAX protease family)